MRWLLLLLVFPILAEAQNVNRVEYYWDTDPGPGNGIALAFVPAATLILSPTIPLTGVSEGFHILYFRSRSAGKWSLPLARAVFVQRGAQIASASFITRLEYFFDNDPGPGNGISIPITAASSITRNFTVPLGTVSNGFHLLYFRAKDANGIWSKRMQKAVFVQYNAQSAAAPALQEIEYFFDTDPGTGNGTTITLTTATVDQSIVVDLSGVAPGFHLLYMRSKDIQGVWGPLIVKPFLAEFSNDAITAVEYFFTDGTTTSAKSSFTGFTAGPDVTINFAAALSGLLPGVPYEIHLIGLNSRQQRSLTAIHAFTTPTVICDPLSAPTTVGDDVCGPGTPLLQASGATAGQSYLWYPSSSGGSPIAGAIGSTYSTPTLVSTTIYYAVILNGTCESARSPVTATILNCNQPPQINSIVASTPAGSTLVIPLLPLISDPDNNLDAASLQVATPPFSGATTSITDGILTVDYSGVDFAGSDYLTIQACDLTGVCVQQILYIDVVGDIVIYNALSPNGDGKNDQFIVQYIEMFPETRSNRLTIFNRWGSIVFEAINYDNVTNVFRGLSKDGGELPSGTYYFKLSFLQGAPERTGFISLRR